MNSGFCDQSKAHTQKLTHRNPEKLLKGSVTSKTMESITIFSLGPGRADKQNPRLKAALNFNRVQFARATGNIWTAVFCRV